MEDFISRGDSDYFIINTNHFCPNKKTNGKQVLPEPAVQNYNISISFPNNFLLPNKNR